MLMTSLSLRYRNFLLAPVPVKEDLKRRWDYSVNPPATPEDVGRPAIGRVVCKKYVSLRTKLQDSFRQRGAKDMFLVEKGVVPILRAETANDRRDMPREGILT